MQDVKQLAIRKLLFQGSGGKSSALIVYLTSCASWFFGKQMTLFSLKMMLSKVNVTRACFLHAPNIMNNITVSLTRALICKLSLESILS